MTAELNILRVAGALGRHAAERHSVIAVNVANADTPGFRARDLEPFAEAFSRQGDSAAAAPVRTKTIESLGAASPNGNTVALEDQLLRAGEAARASEIAATIFQKTIAMLRAAGARPR
jgi:flagellar basal-body rod protein FlgB